MALPAPIAKPFLMFHHEQCRSAIDFYITAFPENTQINEIAYFGPSGPSGVSAEAVRIASVTIAGLEVLVCDSPTNHNFDFTPSWSLFVSFERETGGSLGTMSYAQTRMTNAMAVLAEDGEILL